MWGNGFFIHFWRCGKNFIVRFYSILQKNLLSLHFDLSEVYLADILAQACQVILFYLNTME